VLFGIMTAHTILETARDALFLAKLGPDRLAWAYLAIAGTALLAITAFRRWGKLRDPRRMLIGFLTVGVVGTSAIATTITLAPSISFVLYVWTGLIATLVVPSFWTMIDRSLRIAEAKRVFAVIGAGGTLGAMVGSAIAGGLGHLVAAHHLVTVGAFAFGAATIAAIALAPRALGEPSLVRPRRSEATRTVRPDRYVRWMFAIGLVSTVTLTRRSDVQARDRSSSTQRSAVAFGTIYTGLNVLARDQLGLATLARTAGRAAPVRAAADPVASATGFALTGTDRDRGAQAGDGGLRHSLSRRERDPASVAERSARWLEAGRRCARAPPAPGRGCTARVRAGGPRGSASFSSPQPVGVVRRRH
jgi:hypothetical protein